MSYLGTPSNGIRREWTEDGEKFKFKAAWIYREREGQKPYGLVARYQNSSGKKIVVPYFKANGTGFKPGGTPKDGRPLYGLETIHPNDANFVPEGERDARAVHLLGLPAVTSLGGSQAANKSDWSPLKGLDVVILPDNDEPGRKYAVEVYELLGESAAVVPVLDGIEDIPSGGATDWLKKQVPEWDGFGPLPEGTEIEALKERFIRAVNKAKAPIPDEWLSRSEEKPKSSSPEKPKTPYVTTEEGTLHLYSRDDELYQRLLANFSARIVEESIRDDGVETFSTMTIEGSRAGKPLPKVVIPSEQFAGFSWLMKHWRGCIIEPGQNVKDRLRHAIQTLSYQGGDPPFHTIYSHTGWRCLDGEHVFLMPGHSISAEGARSGIEVEIDEMPQFNLPAPSDNDGQRKEAAKASMECLAAAPAELTIPLMGATYLAPLHEALKVNFLLWFYGPSQTRKTSLSSAFNSHFGHVTHGNIPAEWRDTPARLETKLFAAKDCLLIIDDYCPQQNASDQQRMDSNVHASIRAIGNRKGRGRSRPDMTARPEKPPRAMAVCTAEMLPSGESDMARIFTISVDRDNVDLEQLTMVQRLASNGLLARCMADSIQRLAADYEQRIGTAKQHFKRFFEQAQNAGLRGRTVEQVSFMAVGYMEALTHWVNAGVIDGEAAQGKFKEAWEVLMSLGLNHQTRIAGAQPAEAFKDVLIDLLASGGCHLRDKQSDEIPNNRSSYGWDGENPKGDHIGWVDEPGGVIYLLKTPTLKVVSDALRRIGTPLNLKPNSLWKQLQDRGWLLPGDIEKGRDGKPAQRHDKSIRVNGAKKGRALALDMQAIGIGGDE